MPLDGAYGGRPAVTWGQVQAWTRDNQVPDTAELVDDDSRAIVRAELDDERVMLRLGVRTMDGESAPLTLGELRKAAAGAPDTARMTMWWLMGLHRIVDLGEHYNDDGACTTLQLQRVWG